MKPLPKWVGYVGSIGAILTAVKIAITTGDWSVLVPAFMAVVNQFSHSATGSGGNTK